jgi:DHA2 family multidrug resistance protein-like MFS transporter
MDAYGFLMAGLLLTMGALGDRIGRRRLLLIGAAAFGAASVLAAYAPTAELLILARALLGVGGATLAPSTLALLRGMFTDTTQRRAAIGVWTGAFTGGIALGPIVGGVLLEHFWWGSVFLINVPVMALLLVLGPVLLPESRDPDGGGFDLVSALLSTAAVLLVVHGVKELVHAGAGGWPAVLAGLALGAVFVRRQLRMPAPPIDVRLFREGGFSAAFGGYVVMIVGSAGLGYLAVQYLQVVLEIRPFTAALWQLPTVAATGVGIVLATTLVRWVRPAVLAGSALLVAATGFLLVAQVEVDTAPAALMAAYSVVTLGTGMLVPLAIDLIVGAAPPHRAGAAAGLSEAGSELGGALGIAVLGSIATAVYRSEFAPRGLPADAAETVGSAVAAAGALPAALADALITDAQRAFTSGFTTAATVMAALLAITAAVVAVRLRRS